MRILLSNDDGIHAPGIQTLAKHLREFADVQVVAPDRNRSGASNSLTLESSLRTFTFENGDIAVQMGTPTDCVFLRSEEHTSELQSRENLVCRLLLEKKKKW